MAKEQQEVIYSIKIDVGSLHKDAADIQKDLNDINTQMKELKKNGEDDTVTYQRLADSQRGFKKELRDVNKTLQNNDRIQKAVTGSIEEQRAKVVELKRQWVNQGTVTKDGAKKQKELGIELRRATDELKEQESAVGDNTRNVGNYQEGVENAINAQGGWISSLFSLIKQGGVWAVTIGAVAGAVTLYNKALARTSKGEEILAKRQAVSESLWNALAFAIQIKTRRLTQWLDTIGDSNKGLSELLDRQAALILSEKDLAIAELDRQKIEKESITIQEDLRQIRDDEALSMTERIEANEQLGIELIKQAELEGEIAKRGVELAKENIILNGDKRENIILLRQAELLELDVIERINGLQSEQLVNINSLRREQDALNKERQASLDKQAQLEEKQIEDAMNFATMQMEIRKEITTLNLSEEQKEIQASNDKYQALFQNLLQAQLDNEETALLEIELNEAKETEITQIRLKHLAQRKTAEAAALKTRTGNLQTGSEADKAAASASLSAAQGAAESSTGVYQGAALAQTTMASFEWATKAGAKGSGLGPVGAIAAYTTALLIGLSAVAQIAAVAEKGMVKLGGGGKSGVFGGKAHTMGGTKGYFDDGTNVEVERDEAWFVINKRDTPAAMALSKINSRHGVDFMGKYGGSTFMQDGGFSSRASVTGFTEEQFVNQMIAAFRELPPPEVEVVDIISGVQRVTVIDQAATL